MELSKDEEIVLDLIKGWFESRNAAFLAREEQVIYWDNLTGKPEWVRLSLKETTSVIKTSEVPFGLMKHCTKDMVIAAAQEDGRAYTQAVKSNNVNIRADLFNLNVMTTPTKETPYHEVAVALIQELRLLNENILWKDVVRFYEQFVDEAGLEKPNRNRRNSYIRYALGSSEFEEKRATNTYNGRLTLRENGKVVQYTAIALPGEAHMHIPGIKKTWKTEENSRVCQGVRRRLFAKTKPKS